MSRERTRESWEGGGEHGLRERHRHHGHGQTMDAELKTRGGPARAGLLSLFLSRPSSVCERARAFLSDLFGLGWQKAAATAGAGNEGVTSNPFLSISLLDATLDGNANHSACVGAVLSSVARGAWLPRRAPEQAIDGKRTSERAAGDLNRSPPHSFKTFQWPRVSQELSFRFHGSFSIERIIECAAMLLDRCLPPVPPGSLGRPASLVMSRK